MPPTDAGGTGGTRWERVGEAEAGVAAAERPALGTTARVVVWPPEALAPALGAVDREIGLLDAQASRFRDDSELSRLHRSTGDTFVVSEGLAEAIAVGLAAARWTGGLVDPTVGGALVSLGYDRDFASIDADADADADAHSDSDAEPETCPDLDAAGPPSRRCRPAPGWASVRLRGRLLELPRGIVLDLGATAKALGSDRAAAAAFVGAGRAGGVLVSLGGDIATAGTCPRGGWPITVTEDPASGGGAEPQVVRLTRGALATSSVVCRRWRRRGNELHHIIDPRTGAPAAGPWRTASVGARSCVEANAASTALVVGGAAARRWLADVGLPARIVGHDGAVHLVGPWPRGQGAELAAPPLGRFGGPTGALGDAS